MRSLAIDKSLEGIAGPYLAMLTSPGSVVINGLLGSLEDRTVYGVINIIDTNFSWFRLISLGSSPSSGLIALQHGETNTSSMNVRFDTVNGSTNFNLTSPSNVRVGNTTIVGWAGTFNNMSTGSAGWNTPNNQSNVGLIPGNGMETTPNLVMNSNTSTTPRCALAYRGSHNLTTRTKIINYLRLRYGTK